MVLFLHQRLAALKVCIRVGQVGLGLCQRSLGLIERVLERALVDGEQKVALLDHLAVLEVDGLEIAGDAGAHFDRIHRGEAADIFVIIGDGLLNRLGDGDRRRRRRLGLLLLLSLAAAGEQQR